MMDAHRGDEDLTSLGLRWQGGRLWLLDQRRLPEAEAWLAVESVEGCVAAIQGLAVRGAPLIGVSAALALASRALAGDPRPVLAESALRLRGARPTAVNLMWAMDRMRAALQDPEADPAASLPALAHAIFHEDVAMCDAMAAHGAALMEKDEGVLTHCNTGGLATAGVGTALGVIRRAHEAGKAPHVYVDETRPLLQGARLTAWELKRLDIPHTLICDNMAAPLMRTGRVQRVLVGADRVAANGDFANKIGTYGLAVAAAHHGIPFHPVAPCSTVDLACPDGAAIPIEERDPEEVRGVRPGTPWGLRWSPAGVPVWNPAFDVTPAALVASLVLDLGVVPGPDLQAGALPLRSRLPAPAPAPPIRSRLPAPAPAPPSASPSNEEECRRMQTNVTTGTAPGNVSSDVL